MAKQGPERGLDILYTGAIMMRLRSDKVSDRTRSSGSQGNGAGPHGGCNDHHT